MIKYQMLYVYYVNCTYVSQEIIIWLTLILTHNCIDTKEQGWKVSSVLCLWSRIQGIFLCFLVAFFSSLLDFDGFLVQVIEEAS